jgi:GH24 family phage-related lysozyme (muramidase)
MDDTALLAIATPLIAADEGCRLQSYRDTQGIWTIGYGHAHVEPGLCWTQSEANAQLRQDLKSAIAHLDCFLPWWRSLCDARRYVLLNMTFELGIRGLLGFGHALDAIRTRRFAEAASLMLASNWAKQVPARARRLARIMSSARLEEQ